MSELALGTNEVVCIAGNLKKIADLNDADIVTYRDRITWQLELEFLQARLCTVRRLSKYQEAVNRRVSNRTPTVGMFAGYSQNPIGTGLQGKVLAAYGREKVSVTRDNALEETEPGSGAARLRSRLISGETGWAAAFAPSMVATPYVSLRYSDATRAGYTEQFSGDVGFPISYDAFRRRLVTGAVGLHVNGMLTEKVGYQIDAGASYDIQQKTSSYAGSSEISGLESFALGVAGSSNRTRGSGSIGVFYQATRAMRLIGNVSFSNQAFSDRSNVFSIADYQIAF